MTDHTRSGYAPELDMDTTAVRRLPPPPPFQDYPHVQPRSHRRSWQPWGLAAFVLTLGIILSAAATVVWVTYIHEDSGVTACKALAGATPAPKPTHTAVVTQQQAAAEQRTETARQLTVLRELRGMFADSRHNDLHNAGIALVDLTAQLLTADDGTVLVMSSRLVEDYAALAGACGAHGIPLQPLDTK